VAALALIPLFSLAGVPPLSGFIAKLAIVTAAAEVGRHGLVFIALAVSLLTLLSMARCWDEAFWKPGPRESHAAMVGAGLVAPIAALAFLTLGFTFAADRVFDHCRRAAEQLLHPDQYVRAVLGP
jgi:multicomponent Na+:H+ antiporter subunit D